MTEQTYIEPVASRPDDQNIPIPLADFSGPSASPATSAYTHLSYTTTTAQVPSFPYSSSSDPLLLTPISVAGSPPMQHATKFLHQYNSPPGTSSPQQLTPPSASAMFWPPPAFGRADSPMDPEHSSTSATPSHFDLAYIAADNTREDIPEPPTPYFGHFGVSESCKPDSDDRLAYYDMSNNGPPTLLIEQPPGEQIQQNQGIAIRTPLPQNPAILPSENPPIFQQPNNLGAEPIKSSRGSPSRVAPNESSARVHDRVSRVSKKSKQRLRAHRSRDLGTPPSRPEEAIRFKPSVPEEERFLVKLRMQYSDVKGKTMWEDIVAEFEKRFGKKPEKAALQMKLSRAKHKWIQWSKRDEDILREVFHQDEKDRYRRIAAKFHERGGGGSIGFNSKNIECQLVEMGLEELYVDPTTEIRARTKANERRHSTGKSDVQAPQLGVHQVQFYDGMGGFALTDDQREVLYQQVERREMPDDGDSPMEGVMKDEDDVRIKEEGQQDMRVLQQAPSNLTNGHMSHFHVGDVNGGEI